MKLDTTIIGEKHGQIDARIEKWIVDEKKDCTESLLLNIRMWDIQDDSDLKTETLHSMREELRTGKKQFKNFGVEI